MSHGAQRFRASEQLRARAHRLIPGGAHTYAKGDDQYPVLAPGFIARGAGAHVWDVDGNEFIEYGMGNRAVGLGHAEPRVLDAVRRELGRGCNFTRPSPIEAECAEQFLALVTTAEMVKFCKDGSDATSGAVRLARAYTGRDLIACCADHPFFSTDDWFIGTTPMNAGIPEAVRRLTVSFRYNDLDSARALFERHPGQIAALILEAVRVDDPDEGYLRQLLALCHANGALLILDEMITGFRWHNGGAQAHFGIVPDLSCFGKALANGFSVSALAGKREIMRLGGLEPHERPRVFLLSTTHGAETHALAAAIATMRVYEREDVIAHLKRAGTRLTEGFAQAVSRHGLGRHVQPVGKPQCLAFATRDGNGAPSQAFRSLFLQELIQRGVLAPSLVVSYAHTDDDIDRTVDAIDGALAVYARALADGVERHLVGRPSEIVFRAYNRREAVGA
ncbi:MAG TPA: glutamate-1-semialdehyde 2,1-aminomutase [Magnetospirillum sp.]|nr:glutamate-1-semialdehyde 2,1-aminomutase [Magnetospirillum sp.]